LPFLTTGRARDAGRPVFFITLLALAIAAQTVRAQQPAAPPIPTLTAPVPQAPPPPPRPPAGAGPPKPAGPALAFSGDVAVVLYTVRAEGASDFEAFFAKVRQALWTGARPEYQGMAAGWTLLKGTQGPQSGQVLYWSIIDPVVKGADYDPIKVFGEVFPSEAATMYPKLKDAIIGVNVVDLLTANKLMAGCYVASLPCYKLRRPF
jgi:hypothetical protein